METLLKRNAQTCMGSARCWVVSTKRGEAVVQAAAGSGQQVSQNSKEMRQHTQKLTRLRRAGPHGVCTTLRRVKEVVGGRCGGVVWRAGKHGKSNFENNNKTDRNATREPACGSRVALWCRGRERTGGEAVVKVVPTDRRMYWRGRGGRVLAAAAGEQVSTNKKSNTRNRKNTHRNVTCRPNRGLLTAWTRRGDFGRRHCM